MGSGGPGDLTTGRKGTYEFPFQISGKAVTGLSKVRNPRSKDRIFFCMLHPAFWSLCPGLILRSAFYIQNPTTSPWATRGIAPRILRFSLCPLSLCGVILRCNWKRCFNARSGLLAQAPGQKFTRWTLDYSFLPITTFTLCLIFASSPGRSGTRGTTPPVSCLPSI